MGLYNSILKLLGLKKCKCENCACGTQTKVEEPNKSTKFVPDPVVQEKIVKKNPIKKTNKKRGKK